MLKFAKLQAEVKTPRKGTEKSAGFDIAFPNDVILPPKDICVVPSGLMLAHCPDNCYLRIVERSSFALKKISVKSGVVDEGIYEI